VKTLQADVLRVAAECRDLAGSGGNVERRRSSRFRVQLPVLTQWTDHEGQVQFGGGFTRDVCLRGVLVISSKLPPQGAVITVTVVLPNARAGSQELHLHSPGSVVRVEQSSTTAGYAISCDFKGIEEIVQ
jgi:hypothetical protein